LSRFRPPKRDDPPIAFADEIRRFLQATTPFQSGSRYHEWVDIDEAQQNIMEPAFEITKKNSQQNGQ
jgi:hypothetical protein